MNHISEEKKEAYRSFIRGLLFEVDSPEKDWRIEKIINGINQTRASNDREQWQKIALGELSVFLNQIEKSQLVAISKKIAGF